MLVQEGNGKIHSAAAGYSDLEHHAPMRVDDAFHMASINKTVTAVSVLRLVDEGKLSLHSTLQEQLGEAVSRIPYADRITVSQLLDHSSGIYATNNDMAYLTTIIGPKADPVRVWRPDELVALADKDRSKPSGLPGEGHYYSDTNYILLGMIVERTSQLSYKEYVRKTVLQPLGMQSTYFYSDYLGKNAAGANSARLFTFHQRFARRDRAKRHVQTGARRIRAGCSTAEYDPCRGTH